MDVSCFSSALPSIGSPSLSVCDWKTFFFFFITPFSIHIFQIFENRTFWSNQFKRVIDLVPNFCLYYQSIRTLFQEWSWVMKSQREQVWVIQTTVRQNWRASNWFGHRNIAWGYKTSPDLFFSSLLKEMIKSRIKITSNYCCMSRER